MIPRRHLFDSVFLSVGEPLSDLLNKKDSTCRVLWPRQHQTGRVCLGLRVDIVVFCDGRVAFISHFHIILYDIYFLISAETVQFITSNYLQNQKDVFGESQRMTRLDYIYISERGSDGAVFSRMSFFRCRQTPVITVG